jgi:hypothetical protein
MRLHKKIFLIWYWSSSKKTPTKKGEYFFCQTQCVLCFTSCGCWSLKAPSWFIAMCKMEIYCKLCAYHAKVLLQFNCHNLYVCCAMLLPIFNWLRFAREFACIMASKNHESIHNIIYSILHWFSLKYVKWMSFS